MARIQQYFAPLHEFRADTEGWTALERAARAEDELYREASRDTEETGRIYADTIKDLSWPFNIYRLQSLSAKYGHSGGIRIKEPRGGGGNSDLQQEAYKQYLNQSAQAEADYRPGMQDHVQISRGAGALGRIAGLFGQDLDPKIWSSASNTPQYGETDINPATGLPIDRKLAAKQLKAYNANVAQVFDQASGRYISPKDKMYPGDTYAAQRLYDTQENAQIKNQYTQDRMQMNYNRYNANLPDGASPMHMPDPGATVDYDTTTGKSIPPVQAQTSQPPPDQSGGILSTADSINSAIGMDTFTDALKPWADKINAAIGINSVVAGLKSVINPGQQDQTPPIQGGGGGGGSAPFDPTDNGGLGGF